MNRQTDIGAGHDEMLVRQAKKLFDESVDGLDAHALSRLNQGRQAALEKAGRRSGFRAFSSWVPAASVAVAAVLAIVLWTGQPTDEYSVPETTASDFEILLNDDSIEMLAELEFYSWIDLETESQTETEPGSNVG